MSETGNAAPRTASRIRALMSLWPLWLALIMTAWVQRRSLAAFFSSPDDLRHLQQAVGLRATQLSPFRYLSQVLYMRAMVFVVGMNPFPYHLATWGCHLVNVALLYLLLRRWRVPAHLAGVAATLFGAMPLSVTLLSSAIGMNDELALAFTLSSLLLFERRSRGAMVGSAICFVLAVLCKEGVLFLPIVLLVARPPSTSVRDQLRRLTPLALIAAAAATVFLVLRSRGIGTDTSIYAMRLGSNLFHNHMTFMAWATDVVHVMPDLISSYNLRAWPWSSGVLAVIGLAWILSPGRRSAIGLGLAWWVLGLLPVLPLRFQTYRHYFYAALPGLALAVAATVEGLLDRLLSAGRVHRDAAVAGATRAARVILVVLSLVYAARANALIDRRLRAGVAGADLALDPVLRRQVVAERALMSIGRVVDANTRRIAILSLGTERLFGVRSGQQVPGAVAGQHTYDLLGESIDHGGAVRLFFPQVDSVAFLTRWEVAYRDFDLFLAYQSGDLLGVGQGPRAHERAAAWMMEQRWPEAARDHLERAVEAYPDDRALRLAYARAIAACGGQP